MPSVTRRQSIEAVADEGQALGASCGADVVAEQGSQEKGACEGERSEALLLPSGCGRRTDLGGKSESCFVWFCLFGWWVFC